MGPSCLKEKQVGNPLTRATESIAHWSHRVVTICCLSITRRSHFASSLLKLVAHPVGSLSPQFHCEEDIAVWRRGHFPSPRVVAGWERRVLHLLHGVPGRVA